MNRILITPLVGMGDTLMTVPFLRLLKQNTPSCHITVCTLNPAIRSLLEGNPDIDALEYFPLHASGFVNGVTYILKRLTGRFDTCINFYPSNRSLYNLFSFLTLAPSRIGHTYAHVNFSELNWLKNKTIAENHALHCVEENIALLPFLGITPPTADNIPPMRIYLSDTEIAAAQKQHDSFGTLPTIGIHAGTSTFKNHGKRRWPPGHFAQLINRFPDHSFVLFGTAEDADANKAIAQAADKNKNVHVVDNLTIRQTAALIGTLKLSVTNDYGLMHIASAMAIPVVGILGPTNPAYIYPWKTAHRVVRLGLPCSPCFYYSPKPLNCVLNDSYACLADLPVEQVENAMHELIG